MSEKHNDLAKALAQNGQYDPDRADELKDKAVSTFQAKMKRVERLLFSYMCICAWLFVFTLFHFFQSSTTKALLFYTLLMLIFFETTILMKLWYWIMNSRIMVLKELKMLGLSQALTDDAGAPPQAGKPEVPITGMSRRERTIWWTVLLCGGALIGAVKNVDLRSWGLHRETSLTSQGCVTLEADGGGSAVTEMSFVRHGIDSTKSFYFHAPESASLRLTDSVGRELPVTTSPTDGQTRYDVQLIHPVMPGRRFTFTISGDRPDYATEEGGVWTYSESSSYDYDTNQYSSTVVLPEGASIVSATPWPIAKFTLNNRPTLRFQATRGRSEPFGYTIQYRLAPAEQ